MKNDILKAITAGAAFLYIVCLPLTESEADWVTATVTVMICTVWLVLFTIANGVYEHGTRESL